MPEFHYTAKDVHDRLVRGVLEASDKKALIEALGQQGLFLVSMSVPESASPPLPSPDTSSMAGDVPPEAATDHQASPEASPTDASRRRIRKLVVILAGSCLILIYHLATWKNSRRMDTNLLNQKLEQIHPGMKRKSMEVILGPTYPGSPDPTKTWYFVPPQFILEIPYDAEGGPGSAENRYTNTPLKISLIKKPSVKSR